MKRVLVTGSSGYIGARMVGRLLAAREVELVAGLDVAESSLRDTRFRFYRRDVREGLDDIFGENRIDTVVHTAFVLPPIHNIALMEDINVNGTRNVFEAAFRARAGHVLYTSSATAYGFHPDNDVPLTEESALRGNDGFTYSRTKRMIEQMIAGLDASRGGTLITVLRPCFVVGPGFANPLARHLQKRLVMLPRAARALQYVHEDDLIEIMMLMLVKRLHGAFSVGAVGEVTFREMARMLGTTILGMPTGLMAALNAVAWRLRLSFLTEFPSSALPMVLHPWAVSGEKLARATGYSYRYSSHGAFADFARHAREKRRR